MATYQHCIQNHGRESRWIAFIDLDEFLFSPTGRPLPEVLSSMSAGRAWVLTGRRSVLQHTAQPAGLVTENYIRRSNRKGHNHGIKSVVDPRRVRNFCLAHFFIFNGEPHVAVDDNARSRDSRGRPTAGRTKSPFERLRVNHYTTKSEDEFRRKQLRIRVDNGRPREWTENQIERLLKGLDEVEDRTIQMYLPALREELRVEARARRTGLAGPRPRRPRARPPEEVVDPPSA